MTTPKNPLGMSDEDFLTLNGPSEVPGAKTVEVDAKGEEEVIPPVAATETPAADPAATETPVATETPAATETEVEDKGEKKETPAIPETGTKEEKPVESLVDPKAKPAGSEKPEEKPAEKTETPAATTPDYKVLYEQLMAPIKANGKTIDLKDPAEAIQLMQMGANYTKKMQAIAPYRKVLTMLENHGLLDETRLSFLIDLDKKNPDAIKKLVKDSGIDTLTLDEEPKTTYFEGNHRVTDEEVAFKTAIQDLRSNDGGTDTLQVINAWDQASKEVLWKNPDLMDTIHQQRSVGIYDKVTAEIDRRKVLGTLSANTPFLHAYKQVGDELNASGAFNQPVATGSTTVTPIAATPVATRVAAPKTAVTNSDKANAASSTRSTPKVAEKIKNPLAMSDEDFLKLPQLAGRL